MVTVRSITAGACPVHWPGQLHELGECAGTGSVQSDGAAEKPQHTGKSAAKYWASKGLNTLVDAGQFNKITQRNNGGQKGAADRQALYDRALKVL